MSPLLCCGHLSLEVHSELILTTSSPPHARAPSVRFAPLEFAGRRLAVQAIPVSDPAAVARASREYLRKYQPSPYAQAMVKSQVLPTTLRLEPR
jgi:hypothetical protein